MDLPIAHDVFRNGHRIESSNDLEEYDKASHNCMLTPWMLLLTNFPCLIGSVIHLYRGRPLPFFLFGTLSVSSSVFHYYSDVIHRPSQIWHSMDKATAYMGMLYHFYLVLSSASLHNLFSSIVCFARYFSLIYSHSVEFADAR